MKTAELTGAVLDYWVAKAEDDGIAFIRDGQCYRTYYEAETEYSPSTDWAHGGPIIERERITLAWQPMKGEWMAGLIETENGSMLEFRWLGFNESPMIAAMRAYVVSRFGDTVPDEPRAG